jgi:hypothetical protein
VGEIIPDSRATSVGIRSQQDEIHLPRLRRACMSEARDEADLRRLRGTHAGRRGGGGAGGRGGGQIKNQESVGSNRCFLFPMKYLSLNINTHREDIAMNNLLTRPFLFAVALLIFTASAYTAARTLKAVECKENTALIYGHKVTIGCAPNSPGSNEEWRKDGMLNPANGPAVILRDATTGDVTFEAWRKDGQPTGKDGMPIEPPPAATIPGPLELGRGAFNIGDYQTALKLLKPLAVQGNDEAQYETALMYYRGWGVKQDFPEAMKWFRKAADQGDPWAEERLSEMYAAGQGVPRDLGEAADLGLKAHSRMVEMMKHPPQKRD